jgi:hypothetical protein
MNLLWMYINLVGFVCLVFLFLFLILQGRHTGNCTILFSPFFCSTLLYNDFIVNTYIYIYTIGLRTSFYNLLVPLHTHTLIA